MSGLYSLLREWDIAARDGIEVRFEVLCFGHDALSRLLWVPLEQGTKAVYLSEGRTIIQRSIRMCKGNAG